MVDGKLTKGSRILLRVLTEIGVKTPVSSTANSIPTRANVTNQTPRQLFRNINFVHDRLWAIFNIFTTVRRHSKNVETVMMYLTPTMVKTFVMSRIILFPGNTFVFIRPSVGGNNDENTPFNRSDVQRCLITTKREFASRSTALEQSKTRKIRKTSCDAFEFDRDGLLEFVRGLSEGDPLNLSELARSFNVPNKNNEGNKIVKDFLVQSGIDISLYKNNCDSNQRVRRPLKRISNDIPISLPKPRGSRKLREGLLEEIRAGNIKLGRLIDPKTFTKLVLKDGKVVSEEFTISGRKIPMREVRRELTEEHTKSCLLRDSSLLNRYVRYFPFFLFSHTPTNTHHKHTHTHTYTQKNSLTPTSNHKWTHTHTRT